MDVPGISPSDSAVGQVRLACADLDRRLRAGESGCSESVLEAFPALTTNQESALEVVYTEFVVREQLGQQPVPEEWYTRFPHWREPLEKLFQVHEALHTDGHEHTPTLDFRGTKKHAAPALPRRLGPYELLSELGRGGMGVVYQARQQGLGRLVALKMILRGHHASADELARFQTEVRAVASLQHPNIVQVHEVGEQDGIPFCSLEYVEGPTLEKHLAGTPLRAREAAQLVETLACAMQYAHEQGIVHRDLKPANILLTLQRAALTESEPSRSTSAARLTVCVPKITDFGLAKCFHSDGSRSAVGGFTHTGELLGTPSYMAPEQAEAQPHLIGPATDIYALGVILYETLTGRPPFKADTALETLVQVKYQEPVPPRRLQPKVPRDLETVCLRCLEKEPKKRYAHAADLAQDLRRFLQGESILARRSSAAERAVKWAKRRPAVAALLLAVASVTALGMGGVFWQWQQTLAAKREIEDELYGHSIGMIHRELAANNLILARRMLEDCPEGRRHWEWHYLHRWGHTEVRTFVGAGVPLRRVAFSPDSQLLAGAAGHWGTTVPGEIKVWEVASGRERFTLRGHAGPVLGLAFSPDSRRLATASVRFGGRNPQAVRLWDLDTGQPLHALPETAGNVFSVAFSPDGRVLATAGSSGEVILWDSHTGKQLHELGKHAGNAFAVTFDPAGRYLASAGKDGRVYLWDLATRKGAEIHRSIDLRSLSFSPDGRRLALGGYERTAKILDLTREPPEVLTVLAHAQPVGAVVFHPSGQYLATATNSGTVKLWLPPHTLDWCTLWGHEGWVYDLSFSPDGRWLAASGQDGNVRLWAMRRELATPARTRAHSARITGIACSPDGSQLALAGGLNRGSPGQGAKTICIWNVASNRLVRELAGHTGWLTRVAYAPDGQFLVSGSDDGTARIWETATGTCRHCLKHPSMEVHDVSFHPKGTWVATAASDGLIRLWDANTGELVRTFSGHTQAVRGVAFGPDGRTLFSGDAAGTLILWNVRTGQVIWSVPGHAGAVTALAFSPNGSVVASGAKDGTVKLWTAAAGQERRVRAQHFLEVTDLAFSPDGQRLASTSLDRHLRLWDVSSGREAIFFPDEAMNSVTFSPDGRRLFATLDYTLVVWDNEAPTEALQRLRAPALALQFLDWHGQQACASEAERNPFAAQFHWKAIDQIPTEQFEYVPEQVRYVHDQATYRILTEDWPRYRQLCTWALERVPTTEHPRTRYLTARLLALSPQPVADPMLAVKLAEQAFSDQPYAHHQHTLGLAWFRAGRLDLAATHLHAALKLGWHAYGLNWLVLALVYHQQGQAEQARQCFDRATEWYDRYCRAVTEAPGPVGHLWTHDWMAYKLLLREAKSLLGVAKP